MRINSDMSENRDKGQVDKSKVTAEDHLIIKIIDKDSGDEKIVTNKRG